LNFCHDTPPIKVITHEKMYSDGMNLGREGGGGPMPPLKNLIFSNNANVIKRILK